VLLVSAAILSTGSGLLGISGTPISMPSSRLVSQEFLLDVETLPPFSGESFSSIVQLTPLCPPCILQINALMPLQPGRVVGAESIITGEGA
jgi:hypothetical protein